MDQVNKVSAADSDIPALLAQLRSSQAWNELLERQQPPAPLASASSSSLSSPPGDQPSVAALLAQLNTGPPGLEIDVPPPTSQSNLPIFPRPPRLPDAPITNPGPTPLVSSAPVRQMSFQQALPRLAELSENQGFVSLIRKLHTEQTVLEQKLWQERCAIQAKYEERVKVAITKAKMTGSELSRHQANMLSDAYAQEIRKFDKERVLPAWDGLIAQQQTALEQQDVPTMFSTSQPDTRQLQQRVVQVLEGLVGDQQVA